MAGYHERDASDERKAEVTNAARDHLLRMLQSDVDALRKERGVLRWQLLLAQNKIERLEAELAGLKNGLLASRDDS